MSGADITQRELDNILASYQHYGADKLADYIRAIWKEAWEDGHEIGYKKGYPEGYNQARKELRR